MYRLIVASNSINETLSRTHNIFSLSMLVTLWMKHLQWHTIYSLFQCQWTTDDNVQKTHKVKERASLYLQRRIAKLTRPDKWSHNTMTCTVKLEKLTFNIQWPFENRTSAYHNFCVKYAVAVTIWIPSKSDILMVQICLVVEWSVFWMVVWKPDKNDCFMI